MDIYELDSYRLSDAVKFHTELNPALWDSKTMRPEVREALLKIADDFKTFMGIEDLAVEDITVSGSNAAYSYTPHSDIDLHLIVDFSKLNPDEVYQELFNAKKYQYNDTHDIKIRGYDVELYVQDSNNPVRSLGEYSIVKDDWIRIPVQRRANLDEKSTQQKYEKLKKLVELAIASDDLDRVTHITNTLKKYRQAGLDKHGEFGPENLAYKILRKQGYIERLYQHKTDLEDTKLSLAERKKKKSKKKKFKYGAFGGVFFPGYHYYGQTDSTSDGGGDGGGGESVKESTVNIAKKEIPLDKVVRRFVHFAAKYLKLKQLPKIKLRRGELSHDIHSMGHYVDDHKTVEVETKDRHVMDILRTLAHELTHYRQHERLGKEMPDTAGRTGSPYENEANAQAGIVMRHFQNKYPEFFASTVSEDGDDIDAQYGNQEPTGPEFPPKMPAGTTKIDVSDTLDWYKLGMTISDLDDAKPEDFGQGPPHTVIVFPSDEFEQPYLKQFKRLGLKAHDIDEGLGKTLATGALAAAAALGSPAQAQDAGRVAYQIGKQIYQPSGIFTRAGAEEEIKGMARDLARDIRTGGSSAKFLGRTILARPAQGGERVAANGVGASPEAAYQDALTRAYTDANRRYGPISVGDWRPVDSEKELQQVGGQYQASVVLQGPAPVRESSGYIPTEREKNDPRFKTALTVDIRPGQTGREANKLKLNTDSQGRPDLLMKNLANALKEYKETGKFIIESQQLDEVKMSPSALESWANSPEAQGIRAGFEAEMIFVNTKRDEDEGEMEPDYDYDERPDDIEHVIDFFSNDDWGYGLSSRGARDLRSSLSDEYQEWVAEKISDEWDDVAEDQVKDYMETNVWGDDSERESRIRDKVEEMFGDDDADAIMAAGDAAPRFTKSSDQQAYVNENDLYAKYKEASDAAYEAFEEDAVNEYESQGQYYDEAREYYTEMMMDSGDYSESDFLRDRYGYMSEIADSQRLDWPYWTGGGSGGGERSWDDIADSLRDVVDMEVKVGSGYHSTVRKDDRWIIEPDGSLDPDDSDDMGLEIVSPPMPLPMALDKLKAVIEWGNSEAGAYTNSSTGLHMGVSIPYVGGDVDYVKLVLFMGDEFVLKKFGRASNTYTASAMQKLRQNMAGARNRGELTEAKLDPMGALELVQKNLIELAARYIQDGVGKSKYTSAHIKDGYIEFRSPGGDYLAMESRGEYDDIKNTMLRFARAMQIAGNPALERKEYAKKLYKLISPGAQDDGLKLFAEYAAGTITPEQLKKQWADAVLQKELPNTGKEEFEVYDMTKKNSPDGVIDSFYANGYDAAYREYERKYRNDPRWSVLDVRSKRAWFDVYDEGGEEVAVIRARDIGQATEKARAEFDNWTDDWKIYRRPDTSPEPELSRRAKMAKRIKEPKVSPKVAADNARDSQQLQARIGEPQPIGSRNTLSQTDIENRLGWGGQEADANYEVVDRQTMTPVFKFIANTPDEAARKYTQVMDVMMLPHDTENYGWRAIGQAIPGSTVDLQRQRAAQLSREFTGRWQVKNANTGEVLYTFGGVGNNQGDANRVAQRWVQQSRIDDPVEVVPEMM